MHLVLKIVLSLAPNRADPSGAWRACKSNHSACNASQMKFLQGSILATHLCAHLCIRVPNNYPNVMKCYDKSLPTSADFRDQMVASVKDFSGSKKNGLFINSCFAHCQSELPGTWNNPAGGSPAIQNKVVRR